MTETEKAEILSRRKELAAKDPEGLPVEDQINVAVARGAQIIDDFVARGYTRSGADTTMSAAGALYAAGLLLEKSGLSAAEASMLLAAGKIDAQKLEEKLRVREMMGRKPSGNSN